MFQDEASFRFSSRKEYEEEIKKLLSFRDLSCKSKKSNIKSFDEQYDALIEEYVRFCEING